MEGGVHLYDCYFYLLYKRKGDETTQIPILMDYDKSTDYDSETGIISASFVPTSYFTEKDGGLDIQIIACSTLQDFVNSDVDMDDVVLWSTTNAQISIAKSQLKDAQTIVADDMFTKGIAEMSAYLESGSEEADAAEEFASDAEEFAKGTRSDGETVPHASTSSTDNAKAYKNLAKDWASKIGGAVESGEYSAKYYAIVSDTRSQEAEGYAVGTVSGTPSATFADKNAKDWATKTGSKVDANNYSAKQYALNADASATSAAASAAIVSAHATAIEAIGADLVNIDAVAGDLTNIDAVKSNQANIDAVADNETNINAVNSNKTNIDTVAGISSNVTTVAGKASDVSTVAGIASNVTVVAGKASEVTTVAGVSSDVTTVAGISSEVSTVATNASAVSNVSTNMSDVNDVADDLTKITAVADDLTNIDAVADDLTNIDNAVNYALEAEGFAVGEQNGVPVTSDSPYYQNNAKYYSQEVPALKNAITDSEQRIENLEQAVSGSLVQTNTDATQKNTKSITSANTILPWALLNRVGARATQFNQLANNGDFSNGTTSWMTSGGGTLTASDNVGTFKSNAGNDNAVLRTRSYQASRVYYFTFDYKSNKNFYLQLPVTGTTVGISSSNDWKTYAIVLTSPTYVSAYASIYWYLYSALAVNEWELNLRNHMFIDLTAMNQASLTADQFRAKYPASYYPYNTGGIIPLNPSGFKVVGWNKWNEELENGYYDPNTGAKVADANRVRCENPIPVLPNTSYHFKISTSVVGVILCYRKDGSYIEHINNSTLSSNSYNFTTQSDCYYVKFYTTDTTYNHDICVNISQSDTSKPLHNGVYKAYSETTLDTSFTSDYKYVNENCHDYSENVLVDGQKMREEHKVVGSYTFKGNETWADAPNFRQTLALQGTIKPVVSNDVFANLICPVLVTVKAVDLYNGIVASGISVTSDGRVRVGLNDVASLTGKTIYFELATPTTSLHNEPIPNFPSEDGTTITAITPQTDLVNAIDVPTTIAYMTKISS